MTAGVSSPGDGRAPQELKKPTGVLRRVGSYVFTQKWRVWLPIGAVVIFAAVEVGEELLRNEIVIEPVHAPESVVEAGWTEEVLARAIRQEIREIDDAGRSATDYPHAVYELPTKDPDFTVPGAKISLRVLVAWLRDLIGRPNERLVQDVVALSYDEPCDACGGMLRKSEFCYRLRARLTAAGTGWTVCGPTLSDVTHQTAEEAVRRTHPYRAALYFGRVKNDYGRVVDIAEEMLDTEDTGQRAWALNLIGLVHLRFAAWDEADRRFADAKKRLMHAIDTFKESHRKNPKFSLTYINEGWALIRLQNLIMDRTELLGMYNDIDGSLFDRAIDRFKESICAPEPPWRKIYADSYTGQGFAYLGKDKLDDALLNFRVALTILPKQFDPRDHEDVYSGLYKAWLKRGSSDKSDAAQRMWTCRNSGHHYDYCRMMDADVWEDVKRSWPPTEISNPCGFVPAAYLARVWGF